MVYAYGSRKNMSGMSGMSYTLIESSIANMAHCKSISQITFELKGMLHKLLGVQKEIPVRCVCSRLFSNIIWYVLRWASACFATQDAVEDKRLMEYDTARENFLHSLSKTGSSIQINDFSDNVLYTYYIDMLLNKVIIPEYSKVLTCAFCQFQTSFGDRNEMNDLLSHMIENESVAVFKKKTQQETLMRLYSAMDLFNTLRLYKRMWTAEKALKDQEALADILRQINKLMLRLDKKNHLVHMLSKVLEKKSNELNFGITL